MTRHRLLFALALVLGCGGVQSTPETPHADTDARVAWTLVEDVGSGNLDAPFVPDGDAWVTTAGRVRVRVADGVATPADQAFASNVVTLTHLGAHWLFATRAGEVFRASSPLGTLEPVGTLGGAALGAVASYRNRLALVDAHGDLWLADGESVTRVSSEVPVEDAAFADATFGVRIDMPGHVMRTLDGGATWSAVALPVATVPWVVYENDTEIVLRATSPTMIFAIGREGVPRVLEAPPTVSEPAEAPPDVIAAVRTLLAAIDPGRIASTVTPSGHALFRLSESTFRRVPDGASTTVPEGCGSSFVTTGERFAVACRDGMAIGDGASTWTMVPDAADVWLDPRSERFVTPGPCHPVIPSAEEASEDEEEDEEEIYQDALQELTEERDYDRQASGDATSGASDEDLEAAAREEARERREDDDEEQEAPVVDTLCVHDADTTRDIHVGSWVTLVRFTAERLYVRYEAESGETMFAGIDLDHGDVVEPLTGLGNVGTDDLGIAGDGTFVLRDRDGSDTWSVGTASSREVVTLPEGTRSLVAVDRDHLIAGGYETTYLSSDGGVTFVPFEGEVEEVECGEASCRLGHWVWSAQVELTPAVARLPDAAEVPSPHADTTGNVHVACDRRSWWSGHPTQPSLPPLAGHAIASAGGWLALRARGDDAWTSGAVAGRLGGVGAEGAAFEVALHAGNVAPLVPSSRDVRVEATLLAVTPTLAVSSRCSEGSSTICDLVGFPTGSAPFSTGDIGALASTWVWRPTVMGALALDGGAIAVLLSSAYGERQTHAVATDVVVVMSPDGTFAATVFELGWAGGHRALARDAAGHAGLLLVRDRSTRWLGLDGTIGPSRPSPPSEIATLCDAAPTRDDIDFTAPLGRDTARISITRESGESSGPTEAMVVASLAADGTACIREVSARHVAVDFRGSLTARAEHGTLVGRIAAPGVTSPALTACRVHPTDEAQGHAEASDSADSHWIDWVPLDVMVQSDGTPRVLFMPGVAMYVDPLQVASLAGDRWTLTPTPVFGEALTNAALVRRGTSLVVWRHDDVALFEGTASRPLPASTLAVIGEGDAAITLTSGDDEADRRLVAMRGGSEIARSASLGARTIVSLTIVDAPEGSDTIRGAVGACGEESAHPTCVWRGFTLADHTLSLLATFEASGDGLQPYALARSATQTVVLTVVPGPHPDPHAMPPGRGATLQVLSLDGRTARRLYPAIVPSNEDEPLVYPLAVTLTPTPRVIYADTPSYAARPTHVRVVELRDGAWVDVIDPWPSAGRERVIETDAGLVMIASGAEPQTLRLDATGWHPLPITMPAISMRR